MILIQNMNCAKENRHFSHNQDKRKKYEGKRNKGECNHADVLVWRILCRERWESCVTGLVKLCLRYPTEARDHRLRKVILAPNTVPSSTVSPPPSTLWQESTSLRSSTQTKAEIKCSVFALLFTSFLGQRRELMYVRMLEELQER